MTRLRQLGLLIQWQGRRQADMLPLLVVVQAALAMATVIGYGFLLGDVPEAAALFLSTGATTVTLITVGLVIAPQMHAQAKIEGSAAWMRTLPVPRVLFLAADLVGWTLIALPGMVLALVVASAYYDITLQPTPWVVPAALVVSLTASAVGYAIAALAPPTVAQLLTQLIVFAVLLFSPVSFPADRLPGWLATAHEVLPVQPMADLVRATLAPQAFSVTAGQVGVLVAWCAASVLGATIALNRRA